MHRRLANQTPLLLAGLSLLILAGTMVWVIWMAMGGGGSKHSIGDESPLPTTVAVGADRVLPAPRRMGSVPSRSAEALPVEGLTVEELHAALEREGVVAGEVLLTFRSPTALGAFRARAHVYGLRVIDADGRLLAARVAYRDLAGLARELNEHGGEYSDVGPNYEARIPGLPLDEGGEIDPDNAGGREPFKESLLASIGANGDRSSWGRGVTVAVLDSGVDAHPTFQGRKVTTIQLSESDGMANGHGTAMGSLISGAVAPAYGVAPGADLLDVRVTDAEGVSNTALVAQGIMKAVDAGANVINISLGTFGSSQMLQNAIAYATQRNVVVVAAAGNEQMDRVAYPAAYPGVISVGAVDARNQQAYFSNSGQNLSLAAPGVGVISAYPGNQLVIGSGTSQATAITSGAVATLLSWGYDPSRVLGVLQQNALSTGAPKDQVGAGVLQLPKR